ncbi:bacteriochlorophyll 4-vinyl reductase [Roseivivax marinus]|uniref:bacteriochlorophyll 4-vinyl reductase n=1 Tax=Roseivivax marinus TaxID=1379903 RepID=UPI001F0356BC|nr:bacteriochlorophyll 4-vinyl reductase [Roseivivax marinus]UMA64486.1 bacteriochlorophyll 4-vinyl reductase [Roseivivax marinus]
MSSTSAGLFWTTHPEGMMSAAVVVPLHAILAETFGQRICDDVFADAGMGRLPGPEDSVPEARVVRLFDAVYTSWPEVAPDLLDRAGRVTAEMIVMQRVTARARLLLANMPWSMAAWLLARSVRQNSRAFAGSGIFSVQTAGSFVIFDNPLARPESGAAPSCHFHRALFEHMFQRLVHRDFACVETECRSAGGGCCAFRLTVGGATPEAHPR